MMDKKLLKEIVFEQRESFEIKREIIKRTVPDNFLKTKKISIITGIRRSGKSTLMRQIAEDSEAFYYFNFEDERLLDFSKDDFNSLWEVFLELYGVRRTVFFDEIQYVLGWEKFVGRIRRF